MSNPNAIKWWCQKTNQHFYMHQTHNELPELCKGCEIKTCPINSDPVILEGLKWQQNSPYNNEVLYEYGISCEIRIRHASKFEHKTFKLVYSMPPPVVHYYRNQWMRRRRFIYNINLLKWIYFIKPIVHIVHIIDYGIFARMLAMKVKKHLPSFVPMLAHWKNSYMVQEMNNNEFVQSCKSKLCKGAYGSNI